MIIFQILLCILELLLLIISTILLPIQVYIKRQLTWAGNPSKQMYHSCVINQHTLNHKGLSHSIKGYTVYNSIIFQYT